MDNKDLNAFHQWVSSEDRHEGVFENNNNFTRDYWIAEKTWQAACEYKEIKIRSLQSSILILQEKTLVIGELEVKLAEANNNYEILAAEYKELKGGA